MVSKSRVLIALALLGPVSATLAGCASNGELVVDEGVGVTAVRTACPAVGIADYTGDLTVLTNGDTDSRAIDLVAAMTHVRADCDQAGVNLDSARYKPKGLVTTKVGFDVLVRRTDTHGARDVMLPYFVTVMRGGNVVIAKRVSTVAVHFADGQNRAIAHGEGSAVIDKADATLSREIRERITKKRTAGEADAATDPLADPAVKAAVARATFEVLVGFQLTDQQLAYNATR